VPVVVLAALRASNTGRPVIVATSHELIDDPLVYVLEANGIHYFRGALDDVLGRFVGALAEYPDNTIVFRLTADNVFPDGMLIDAVGQDFIDRNLDYLCCNGADSGLPYGMSVEATRLAHIREAHKLAVARWDREHVTPWIVRKFSKRSFTAYRIEGSERLRCTIDTLDDYVRMSRLFASVTDPVNVGSLELVSILEQLEQSCGIWDDGKRLVMGGAQLGQTYGIANKCGQPSWSQAIGMVRCATTLGIQFFDTARDYGTSEAIIGEALQGGFGCGVRVITKLAPLNDCPPEAQLQTIRAFVEASVYRSMYELRRDPLDVLMLHRVDQLDRWNGAVWQTLLTMQEDGRLNALGASVQSPEELRRVLDESAITFVQMPFNVLDWRWQDIIPLIRARKTERPLSIHVRSVLLQGLLGNSDPEAWYPILNAEAERILKWLQVQVDVLDRQNVIDLCLAYVRSLDWVDGIVVGVETLEQLEENRRLFSLPKLSAKDVQAIELSRPIVPESVLNPASWQLTQVL
jgi:spore coat polysaccharide biosynthesis protein SpsF